MTFCFRFPLNNNVLTLSLMTLATSWHVGCSRGPARVHQPGINPNQAGQAAIAQYDTNGDEMISGAELDKAPGVKAALSRIDSNGDGGVTVEEIAERIKVWQQMGIGLTSFSFVVTRDGTPLSGVTVTFEPEEFLGDEIKPASCVTDYFGGGGATIPKESRPDPTYPPGMHLGLYKVKISKIVGGKETIPAKYNSQTILGQEVANDVPEIANRRVVYALTTK